VSESILTSVKKVLGIAETDTSFDDDITMHINSTFVTLNQLGIGTDYVYEITGATETWADFYIGTRYNSIKSYMVLRVRLLFDPPTNGYLVSAIEKQIAEIEYRLSASREETDWVSPLPVVEIVDEDWIFDGGGP
jgi:hypothetical protein